MEFVLTPEQTRLNEKWFAEQKVKAQKMIEDAGFMTIDQMLDAAEQNVLRAMSCSKCGMKCKSFYTLEKHQGSLSCKKKQAELKGEVYVPKCQTMRHCDICNRSVKFYNFNNHLQTKCHKEAVRQLHEPAFKCLVCDKEFGGRRPKVMLKKHLQTKRHLKRAQNPRMGYAHNACCLKHNFQKLTLHGVAEKRVMVI